MNHRRIQPGMRRRGVILLVVLVMLTIFAIAGITFVLYANSAADSARIARETENTPNPNNAADMDPQAALDLVLGQLIYGVPNDATGVGSALRGHSLAETMYGSWDATGAPSDRPFIGVGRLHYAGLLNQDDYYLPNYTYFPSDNALHDPGRFGTRTSPTAAANLYTGGQNAPYTYPDLNNMALASIRASDGTVLTPSFARKWLFNPNNNLNDMSNPNWTNQAGKYMILRPRPNENPTFLPPADATGDVKNLIGTPGGNDSIWMDIGAPIFTTSSGQQYKMLVAPLVLDLDNRANLNVVGNIMGSGNVHGGNQGWGPWEVNMGKVLNAPAASTEWSNLFLGNPPGSNAPISGRYGRDQQPSSVFTMSGPTPHLYAPVDFNGVVDPPPGAATGPYTLPAAGSTNSFPNFPAAGYGNGATSELQNISNQNIHPIFFNPLLASGDDRLLPLAAHASLLWAGVANTPSSDLVRLSPSNFSSADPATTKRINETTLLSMDLDRPGAVPYFSADPGYTISYNPNGPTPGYTYNNASVSFPTLTGGARQAGVGQEFDPNTWRSTLASQANLISTYARLNLDRKLTDYPQPDPTTHLVNSADPVYLQATTDRQNFALDIYNRLSLVTTGALPVTPMPASGQQHDAYQWMAQLAANMVDYIDTDDIMTPFNWDTTNNGWVFGTELPKLVVNEAYLQYNNTNGENGGNAPPYKATQPYQMNVWVELLNPLVSESNPTDAYHNTTATLMVPGNANSIYQVVVAKQDANIRSMTNTLGDTQGAIFTTVKDTDFGTAVQQSVSPVGGSYSGGSASNQGFYLLGPADQTPNTPPFPNIPDATLPTSKMTYNVQLTNDPNNPNPETPEVPTVLLRRLANPYLPWQQTVGQPNYNPYITVDYVDLKAVSPNAVNDDRQYTSMTHATQPPAVTPTTINGFASWGRMQPYAAVSSQWKKQAPNPMNPTGSSQHTFYRHNGTTATAPAGPDPTLTMPFNWLVQLDRPLISPIELLQVSAFKPHELTQQFVDAATPGNPFGQRAPWMDPASRLYRLLEFVKVKNATPGIFEGGRIPGKVNINTLDPTATEVFQALADAEPGNTFTQTDVQTVFQNLVAARTQNPSGAPGQGDQPFWGMAMGTYQGADPQFPNLGIGNTLLAPTVGGSPTTPRLLEAGTPGANGHPYQRSELLNKLFNNLTTRSNVFAVWLTVGFFPVTNAATTPVQLGPEIGLSTIPTIASTNIRHHMFAIVDRTQLQTFSTTVSAQINAGASPLNLTGGNMVSDPRTGRTWPLQVGSTLTYDPGVYNASPGTANEETVVVQSAAGVPAANFTYPHAAGAAVISRGNPGPWKNYSSSQDSSVVPYFHIID